MHTIQYQLNFDNPEKEIKRLVPSRISRKQKNKYIRKMSAKRNQSTSENFQYVSIVQGEFRVKTTKGTEGAEERTNKNGDTVHELIYNEYDEVFLHSLEVADSEFGKQLKIFLREASNKNKFVVIQVPLDSGYAVSFLSRAAQVDLSKEVSVKVFDIPNKDESGKEFKTKSLTISQGGVKLEKTWNKENAVPKAEPMLDKKGNQIIKNGYPQFDTAVKEDFLEAYVNDVLNRKLQDHLLSDPEYMASQKVDADALTGEGALKEA